MRPGLVWFAPTKLLRQTTMKPINDELARLLNTVQTPGDFHASGIAAMHAPRLQVDGIGDIALPLLPAQAKALIAAAERAPYGRGEETLVDTEVRRTWQIGADHVHIEGKRWLETLGNIVERAAAGLGAGVNVEPELYKLLVYDQGSFFVNHRDTEKSAGMFATLIIALPSVHAGGELVVRHRGREVRLDLRGDDPSEVAFAAFYADCVHEVLPVTSGCRLVLVYNLLRRGKGRLPRPPAYDRETAGLTSLLQGWCAAKSAPGDASPDKLVYLLAHAYTPAELSFQSLKGADAASAAVLAAAAQQAGCDLHAALMKIEESGSAEHTGYSSSRRYGRYHDDDDDDDDSSEYEIGEIIERDLTLSHWSSPDGQAARMADFPFNDAEVCPANALEDLDPDDEHFHEATGNEGASFERSYQRAALVLWPRDQRLKVLAKAGLGVALPALEKLCSDWAQAKASRRDTLWTEAHALSGHLLHAWPDRGFHPAAPGPTAVTQMLTQLTLLHDAEHIDAFVARVSAPGLTVKGDNAALIKALRLLAPERATQLLQSMAAANAVLGIARCADLLTRASQHSSLLPGLHAVAQGLLQALPLDAGRKPAPDADWRREPADATVLADLLRALCRIDAGLADQAVSHWLASPKTYDMDAVIVPALRQVADHAAARKHQATQRLRVAAIAHLKARVALPLAPPVDFAREANFACRCAHCTGLLQFLQSRTESTWRFKAKVSDRDHVQASIRSGRCDIDATTERVGNPHGLVCVKNQASHERRVTQRKEDHEVLARLG